MVVAMSLDEGNEFEWKGLALCRNYGDNFPKNDHPFFIEGAGRTYDIARPICASCPVVVDCLLYIIDDRGSIGFWGATTQNERANIRRHMDNGIDFTKAVEIVWSKNRKKRVTVPPKIVWKDWE